jgi:hypothetical protein
MSVEPFFSEIVDYAKTTINKRAGKNVAASKLSAFAKVVSYAKPGLVITSNPDVSLIGGGSSLYGTTTTNGSVGRDLNNNEVAPPITLDQSQGLRPITILTSLEVEEQNADDGAANFSRQAKFVIRCFSLGQMETVAEHFLEPGISVFLHWGWNTPEGSLTYNIQPASVGKLKDFNNINVHRANTSGHSDTYLGFVTGGEVSMQDDYWDITVNCRGFLELPAYMMAADNGITEAQKAKNSSGTPPPPLEYSGNEISAETSAGKKRWMLAFNDLPSNKRTAIVKGLESKLADIGNFINFDEGVKDAINSTTKKGFWASLFGGGDVTIKFGSAEAELAEDTKIVNDERYIRFGALMQIINASEIEGLELSGQTVPFAIRSDRTACTAFQKIFSTDKTKLFIPNQNTPKADFVAVAENGGVQTDFSGVCDNRVSTTSGAKVEFPTKELDVPIPNISSTKMPVTFVKKQNYTAGMLDYLYVNFDFAKKILETKSLPMKDALYQILNGMSGAAGSIWDFQIVDLPNEAGVNQLHIVDRNLTDKTNHNEEFVATGVKSPFLEVGLSMDISGQLASQVMLNKSAAAYNSSMPPVKGLFLTIIDDLLQTKVTPTPTGVPRGKPSPNTTAKPTDAKAENERKKRDFATFLGKVGLAPGVKLDNTVTWPADGKVHSICYQTAFDDLNLFEALKTGSDYIQETGTGVSIQLPINLTLKMHGVSGIKRGDKIKIDALPKQYKKGGFFQVTGITQTLNEDYWTTEVKGTFRTYFQSGGV